MLAVSAPPDPRRTPPLHRQGSLDGLCGLYAIINAMQVLLGDRFDAQTMFATLLCTLRGAPHVIAGAGMSMPQLISALRSCSSLLARSGIDLRFRKAFPIPPDSLAQYWQVLAAHHQATGDGSILLGLTGHLDHWTCVRHVMPEALVLADSGTLDRLSRAHLTIRQPTRRRPCRLMPSQTFLLSVTSLNETEILRPAGSADYR